MAFLLALFFVLVGVVTVAIFQLRIWWLPELISEHGALIDNQLVLTLAIAGAVFLLAQVGLGLFIWRNRGRKGQRAIYWHENGKLEATWTIATAVIFVGLAIRGNMVWADYQNTTMGADDVVVEVTAQQFAWNIRYPGEDGEFGRTDPELIDDALGMFLGIDPDDPLGDDDVLTQNVMAVPVNRPVRVLLRTKDVTHSFFVPQLRVKQDTLPGLLLSVHFTANKIGEYEIACAELCGMQHYMMRGRLLVMEQAEYEDWLAARTF